MLHISDKHPETIRKIEAALGEGEYHRENHFTKDRSGKWQYTSIHHFAITGLLPVIDALEGMLPYLMCKKREAWETYKRLKSRQLMRAYSRRNSEAGSAVVD